MNRNPIIAIDFDGVVCVHRFPRIGALLPGAKETITKLWDEGYYIIIWTCRGGVNLVDAIEFLKEWDIPYHKINENAPFEMIGFKPFPKIYADIYIDDRNLGSFPGWEAAYKIITDGM